MIEGTEGWGNPLKSISKGLVLVLVCQYNKLCWKELCVYFCTCNSLDGSSAQNNFQIKLYLWHKADKESGIFVNGAEQLSELWFVERREMSVCYNQAQTLRNGQIYGAKYKWFIVSKETGFNFRPLMLEMIFAFASRGIWGFALSDLLSCNNVCCQLCVLVWIVYK